MPRRASIPALVAALLVGGAPLHAQSCSTLPTRESEMWIGGASWSGSEASQVEMGFAINVLDRIHLSADMGVATMVLSLGGSVRLGGLDVCLFAAREAREYAFLDRFELDRGDVLERSTGGGVNLTGILIGDERTGLGWSLSSAVVFRRFEMLGRRLIVDETVLVEEVHQITTEYQLTGQAALTWTWRSIGGTIGIANRPSLGAGVSTFARLGVVALRF